MIAQIQEFFSKRSRPFKVLRVTKLWIVVQYNNVATGKFSRKTGLESGAFQDRLSMTPSSLLNYEEINKVADANGGIIDFTKLEKGGDNDKRTD